MMHTYAHVYTQVNKHIQIKNGENRKEEEKKRKCLSKRIMNTPYEKNWCFYGVLNLFTSIAGFVLHHGAADDLFIFCGDSTWGA